MSNPFNQTFQNGSNLLMELCKKYGLKFDENLYAYSMELVATVNTPPERDDDLHSKVDRIIDRLNDMNDGDSITVDEAMEIGQVKPCRSSKQAVRNLLRENKMLIFKPSQKETYVKQIGFHDPDEPNQPIN